MPTYKIVGVFLIMGLFGLIGKVKALEVGSPAPDITALDENGAEFRFLDAYAKGPALVFFYPKADTPGCTAQACSLRDAFESLQAKNLQIVGVSRDTAESQKNSKITTNSPSLSSPTRMGRSPRRLEFLPCWACCRSQNASRF